MILKKGDRIRVNVRLLSGRRGLATVTEDQSESGDYSLVKFLPDGNYLDNCYACRYQVSKLRDQGRSKEKK